MDLLKVDFLSPIKIHDPNLQLILRYCCLWSDLPGVLQNQLLHDQVLCLSTVTDFAILALFTTTEAVCSVRVI